MSDSTPSVIHYIGPRNFVTPIVLVEIGSENLLSFDSATSNCDVIGRGCRSSRSEGIGRPTSRVERDRRQYQYIPASLSLRKSGARATST